MPLSPGMRLGPYEIVALLGAGGMGEVYRARDARLGRDVAIKVLPASWADDAERIARFRREAQLLAALNHPNIATIHGVEEHAGSHALVLELVDGPTLADLIADHARATPDVAGALPLVDALVIARQIALALEAAHEAGIVHRDLKPANVKLKGAWGPTPTRLPDGRLDPTLSAFDVAGCTVKVLDFGLAKALAPDASSSGDVANSPTMTSPATAMGMLLGTAAYMAPEQAKGRAVDRRADVWAFGCVLFEMLTGRRAFAGEDISDTLAAVLRGEPEWSALPPETPVAIRRLLRRCLVKDRKDRLTDIGMARLEIDDASAPAADDAPPAVAPALPSRSRVYERVALAMATVAIVVATPLAIRHLREAPVEPPRTVRLPITVPSGTTVGSTGFAGLYAAISPDGRLVVFHAARSGQPSRLWLRALDSLEARELPGTDNAGRPFWSPDSRLVAFHAGGLIRTIDVTSGLVRTVAGARVTVGGAGTWSADGTIVFVSAGALWRIPAAGGEPVVVVASEGDGRSNALPAFLPDGRRFLYTVMPTGDVYLGSLDTPERTRVLEDASNVAYAPPGYLLFARNATLLAQRFDAARGEVRGDPVPLVTGLAMRGPSGRIAHFSVSATGTLVHMPGAVATGGTPVWVDRQGRETPLAGSSVNGAQYPRLSPDGRRLALVANGDIWVHDLAGRPPIRLTFDGSRVPAFSPLWTPDGRSLVYERGQQGGGDAGLWLLPADGSASTPVRVSPTEHLHPHGWSADGRELIAVHLRGEGEDIVGLPFVGDEPGEPRPVVATPAREGGPGASLSPNGRWLAYAANPTGTMEIWVRPYPGPGAPARVSPDGGIEPVWSRDGRELFYREEDRVVAVAVQTGAEFRFESPVALVERSYVRSVGQPPTYDVAPDGRFLMLQWPPGADPGALPHVVVLNWATEIEQQGER